MCVCVCVLYDNSKSYLSRNKTLEYIVVYENISDKFDNGNCLIKVKVTVGLRLRSRWDLGFHYSVNGKKSVRARVTLFHYL